MKQTPTEMSDLAVPTQMKAYGAYMSRFSRRLLVGLATAATLATATLGGIVATAAPAGAATHHVAAADVPCVPIPIVGGCVPGTGPGSGGGGGGTTTCDGTVVLGVCVPGVTLPVGTGPSATCTGTQVPILGICLPSLPGGGLPTDPGAECTLVLTTLGLPAAEVTAVCAALDETGGAPGLPTGTSSASPNTFPNNATAQQVVITDPFEQLYSAAGGATVTLNGASTIATTGDPALDDAAGTITATFDLTKPTPAAPGAYTLTITPKDPTGLTTILAGLGLPSLPLDTVPVTVTKATGPAAVTGLTATPINGTSAAVKWTAPTGTDPVVTGYSIIVSKTTTATATDSGITVTQTGTTTSASVSGLTAGTKYYVTVAAKSASGNGAAATTTFTTPYVSSLTLVTNPSSAIVGGGKLEMSGELDHMVSGAKTPLSGKTVGLLVKYTHATHSTKITTVTTDANGKYDFTFTPAGGGQFVAAFLGDAPTSTTPGDSYAVSNIATVTDTPAVTLSGTSKKSGKKHEFLKLKGTVSPNEQGKKVFIFSTGGGADQKIGKARLGSNGKYALKKRVKKGNYTLEARVKAHGALLAASSNSITL